MRPTLRQNLASLRPIRGLLLSVAVARSSVLLFPFYGAYLATTKHGLPPAGIGLIIGAFGVGALLADIVVSRLTRHLSERTVAVVGLFGVAATVVVVPAISGIWPLALLTAVWGFCYELVNPLSYTLVARAMPESARRFAFAAVRVAVNAGMGIGPVLAGVLFKIEPGLLVWGTAIGFLVAAGILARARLRHSPPDAESVGETTEGASPVGAEWRFWSFFTAILPVHVAYALPPTVISVYVIQKLGHPPIWVSAVFAVNALMVISLEITINHLMNHWQRRSTLLVGYACAVVGFGLMGFGATPWMLIVATAFWTLGEMIVFPAMLDHVAAISPTALKARNIGLYAAGVNVGVLVAPLAFLPIAAKTDAVNAWALVAGTVALGMAGVTALSTHRRLWMHDTVAIPVDAER